MRAPLGLRLTVAAVFLLVLVLPTWLYLSSHDVGPTVREFLAGKWPPTWPPPPKPDAQGGGSAARPLDALDTLLTVLRWAAVAAGLSGLLLVVLRLRHRHLRAAATTTWELRLGRDDLANPYRVQEAFEGITGAITARWYERIWRGQDHLALEVHRLPDQSIRFTVAAPRWLQPAIQGPLEDLYPDVELQEVSGRPSWGEYVVRLKKRRSFVLSIQTTRNYEHAFTETLVSMLSTLDSEASVQLVLTPAPGFVHRRARALLKRRERGLQYADHRDEGELGIDSIVEYKELKGALETQHRSLCYFDLRIAGREHAAVRRVAGLFSQLRSENELARRQMRLRRRRYARRVELALPNPLPGFRTGLLSTSELPTLWQLPRARVKHARLPRATTRRAIAPPEISREPAHRLLEDERGAVGIARADRKYGLALMGGQGGGKSSEMAQLCANDAQDRERALVPIDMKGPLAELCLGLIPADRTVHYLDLGHPEIGLNPLTIDAPPGVRASIFVQALIEANPPGAIQAASDSFLRQAIYAVCTVEPHPTLWHVYRMLDFADSDYRQSVVDRLEGVPGADFARHYWRREFPALISDKGFAAKALNPPRNKLERLISTREIDTLLRHPVSLDLEGIIERGEVLIVNGAKATVGEDNAVLVTQLLLQLLHRTIQAQQRLPEERRRKVSLLIDEAHNVLTPSVAKMLAEGRSAGLEACFAWQYSAQIRDEVIRSGVRSLLQSISIFRMREIEDARSLAGLAMEVYSDRISVDQDEQERLRFSADDILKLPIHRAINLWVADGVPRAGFLARTLPMEELHDEWLAGRHLEAQRERGGHHPEDLPTPLPDEPDSGKATSKPTTRRNRRSRSERAKKQKTPSTHKNGNQARREAVQLPLQPEPDRVYDPED